MARTTFEDIAEAIQLHRDWLAGRSHGVKLQLIGADLEGINLSGMNLMGADLSNSNLYEADLSFSNFRNADLSHANLSHASLAHSDLREADLRGANISWTILSNVKLSGSSVYGTNFCAVDSEYSISLPIIKNIHQAVYEAASQPRPGKTTGNSLEMGLWHCGTTHCRAGWVITLAGAAGKELEDKVGPSPVATSLTTKQSNTGKILNRNMSKLLTAG